MALMRVYCGLAATEPDVRSAGDDAWLTAAVVDDAGRLLDVCAISDDATGYAELGALLAERSGGAGGVAVAADDDEHEITLLLAAAGQPLAIADEEMVIDYAERFADDESPDEIAAAEAERNAVGLARALQAGALVAAGQNAPRELMALKPVLVAHAAMAASRHGSAVALREVLRELYPAALRAYPDPAEPIPLAILDALPEPSLLGVTNRGRDAAVAAELAMAGVADPTTIADAITALRVAAAETPRRTGIGKGPTSVVAETIRQAVAAVRACDAAVTALIGLVATKSGTPRMAASRLRPVSPRAIESARAVSARVAPDSYDAVRPQMNWADAARGESAQQEMARHDAARASRRARASAPVAGARPESVPADALGRSARPPAQRTARASAHAAADDYDDERWPASHAAAHGIRRPSWSEEPATEYRSLRSEPDPTNASTGEYPLQPRYVSETAAIGPGPSAYDDTPRQEYRPEPAPTPYPERNGYSGVASNGYAAEPSNGYGAGNGYSTSNGTNGYPIVGGPTASSRETWPLNPPDPNDDMAYTAPYDTAPYTPPPPPVDAGIPHQRNGRVAPPWQTDDLALPAEPAELRSDPVALRPEPPALRLVGPDERPSAAEPRGRDGAYRENGWRRYDGSREDDRRDNRGDPARRDSWDDSSRRESARETAPIRETRAETRRRERADENGRNERDEAPVRAGRHGAGRPDETLARDARRGGESTLDSVLAGSRAVRDRAKPSVAAAYIDEPDDDLLIFSQARSAWFDGPQVDDGPASWSDAGDLGWSAAERAAHPTVGEETEVGLPRRVPKANLVPGSPLPPATENGRTVRDPAAMAAHTTGYFRGSRRGEEVRGYAVGGRPGRESGDGWDFSRDGWDSEHEPEYPSAARW